MEDILEKYKEIYLKSDSYDDYDDYDSFEEESIPEELEAINLLNDLNIESIESFKSDASNLAKYYINIFFDNKNSYNNSLEKSNLLTQEKIYTVLNTNITSGVKKAYEALETQIIITKEDLNKAKKNGDVTEEIKLVNETLKVLHKAGVPQQFAGGMMILYLEYCKGINFGT